MKISVGNAWCRLKQRLNKKTVDIFNFLKKIKVICNMLHLEIWYLEHVNRKKIFFRKLNKHSICLKTEINNWIWPELNIQWGLRFQFVKFLPTLIWLLINTTINHNEIAKTWNNDYDDRNDLIIILSSIRGTFNWCYGHWTEYFFFFFWRSNENLFP